MKKLKKYKKVSKPVIVKVDTKSKPLSLKVGKKEKTKRNLTVEIKDNAKEISKGKGIHKTAEFQAYVLWKSLPATLRGLNEIELEKIGIKEEETKKLLIIKSQVEFAEKFKMKAATCSEWNKIIDDENLIFDNIRRWAKAMTPNVIMALGKTAIKTGKSPEVTAWVKIVDEWKEKSEVGINASDDLIKVLEKVDKLLKLP